MYTLQNILDTFEQFASPDLARFEYVGLLSGDRSQPISKVGLCLDYCLEAIEAAIQADCDLLITHHGPTSLKKPSYSNEVEKLAVAAHHDLAIYRAHLNLDFCPGGIIETLCDLLQVPTDTTELRYLNHKITGGVRVAKNTVELDTLLASIKQLDIPSVRLAGPQKTRYQRVAITSGQGFNPEFFEQLRPELYVAGEFEQEALKYAEDMGITLLELGHYYSEARPLAVIASRLTGLLQVPIVFIPGEDTIRTISLAQTTEGAL